MRTPSSLPAKILLATHDNSLRVTRAYILKGFGYQVVAPNDEQKIVTEIRKTRFDLLMLGDSLSKNAAERFSSEFRQHPNARVLEFIRYAHDLPKDSPDETVVGLDGPMALHNAIQRQLRFRK